MQAVSLSKIIEKMELVNLTPEIDVESIKVEQTDINRPALQLTGFFDHFPTDRVQVIGYVEYTYLKGMEEERKKYIYGEILSKKVPCIIFCRDLQPDDILLELANKHEVPILVTGT